MKRTAPVKKRRSGTRRGRLVDRQYLAWLHEQPGIVHGGVCHTVHHVRLCGSPKNDRQAVPLEFGYHQIQDGPESIESLGKTKFQRQTGVSLSWEIYRLNALYLREHPEVKW